MPETDFLVLNKSSDTGFSLVSVMVALALAGGVSVLVLKLMTNVNQAKKIAVSNNDEAELVGFVKLILKDEKHCRISLLGNGPFGAPDGPVVFKKQNIDEKSEGLPFEIFLSNQAGDTRQTLKLSAIDANAKKYSSLEIKSILLRMNNGTGFNYSTSFGHTDIGEVEIEYSKLGKKTIRKYFPINVSMITDTTGESSIVSCHM